MRRRAIVLAAALAMGPLAGCREPASKGDQEGAAVASLEECGAGDSAFARRLCGNQKLAALDKQIRETLVAEIATISDAGAQLIAQGQQRWLETQRIACGVIDPESALTPDQVQCMESALQARAREAAESVQEIGAYRFQTVEITGADPVSAAAADASGLGEDAPAAIVREIRFPRIDGDAAPNAQRFNQLVAQQPRYRLEDQTEEQVDYKIVYAGPEIISVRFDLYDNTLGAAHPNNTSKAVTVVMTGEGRALTATDVFRAGSGWEDFVTDRAMTAITQQFREYDGFVPPERDVRESATKPHLWLVTPQGLTILFPPYSFGGPHALGGAEVAIPWGDLQSYLAADPPQPIGLRA